MDPVQEMLKRRGHSNPSCTTIVVGLGLYGDKDYVLRDRQFQMAMLGDLAVIESAISRAINGPEGAMLSDTDIDEIYSALDWFVRDVKHGQRFTSWQNSFWRAVIKYLPRVASQFAGDFEEAYPKAGQYLRSIGESGKSIGVN